MKSVKKLFKFIESSPTSYHVINTVKSQLLSSGYTELTESDSQRFSDGERHFVVRGGSSIIAFRGKGCGFNIVSSHSDTPAFKIKSDIKDGAYIKISSEKYGGAILYSWLDRPLSVAGRVAVDDGNGISIRLVDIARDVAVIPSLAIHMNRGVNDGYKFNFAKDMQALIGLSADKSLMTLISECAGIDEDKIISHDLFLYNREEGKIFGSSDSLILSPRLDDTECVFASLEGFLSADKCENGAVDVLAVFDNEEVGSSTRQGANSTFLNDTLGKIAGDKNELSAMLENSIMISADNAHAKHPCHPELSDDAYYCVLGGGIVLKYNAGKSYATDSVSAALVKKIAGAAGVRVQEFASRADMPCGSTLGAIATTRVPLLCADIGLAQLSMHSATESAAVSDLDELILFFREIYATCFNKTDNGYSISNCQDKH